jgi:3-methyl-2-oxobutanoate hydroxymethyltransferase
MLTAYDFPTGRACESYGIDITLVGDSLAQVCLGYDSTTRLTMDEMVHHSRAVSRGSITPLLVADMPFGSYHTNADDAVRNAVRLVREGCVEGVKLEGGEEIVEIVTKLTTIGIPVMAHVGLLPQRHTLMSGYRVQGRMASSARGLLRSAVAMQDAGAFAIVLEAIPHVLGSYITGKLSIPTIGIGAGPGTSGQVLVWDDVMSTWSGHKAKFVRRFADVKSETEKGITGFIGAVRERTFPDPEKEGYEMDKAEWDLLLKLENAEGRGEKELNSMPLEQRRMVT